MQSPADDSGYSPRRTDFETRTNRPSPLRKSEPREQQPQFWDDKYPHLADLFCRGLLIVLFTLRAAAIFVAGCVVLGLPALIIVNLCVAFLLTPFLTSQGLDQHATIVPLLSVGLLAALWGIQAAFLAYEMDPFLPMQFDIALNNAADYYCAGLLICEYKLRATTVLCWVVLSEALLIAVRSRRRKRSRERSLGLVLQPSLSWG